MRVINIDCVINDWYMYKGLGMSFLQNVVIVSSLNYTQAKAQLKIVILLNACYVGSESETGSVLAVMHCVIINVNWAKLRTHQLYKIAFIHRT